MIAPVGVTESLVLMARSEVAPSAWESAHYPCGRAVGGGVGHGGRDRRKSHGTVISQWSGKLREAVGIEEGGVGVAGQECRVA